MRLPLATAIALACVTSQAAAQDMTQNTTQQMTAPAYPQTSRGEVVETLFGDQIADPYRWLEDDVRVNPQVADWVARQNAVTDAYLTQLPARDWFRDRIAALYDFERFSTPVKRGERYFFERNSGLQNQSPLYVRDRLTDEARLLIDPNQWSGDDATALGGWQPSPDGSKLLYAVQDGGSDWRTLRVLDVATGDHLSEEIRWAKFTNLAWVGEDGFLYSRFPEPGEGEDFQALNFDQAVYYHRLGTPQSEDQLVFATPDHSERNHVASVTHDGRWAVITSSVGTDDRYEIHLIDLARAGAEDWQAIPLITGFEHAWDLVDGIDGRLWFTTNRDAPLSLVVSIDMDVAQPRWQELVREGEHPIQSAALIGDRLVVSTLRDVAGHAEICTREGELVDTVELAGLGSLGGFSGEPDDSEAFYSFTSFNRPATIYRLDASSGETTAIARPELAFDPDDFVVEQRFYTSKDGTRIPLFVTMRKDVAMAGEPVPTLLYGYGGFNISVTPAYSVSRMAWVQAGGAYVVANIRGGGEYGKAWHDAGRLTNKQNVFDDFIAAGEYLVAEGIASQDGLAIQGGSNGGLLVGAVVNQRPELFAAGNAAVGVMDMLRFDRFTAGRYWVDDYGYPDRAEDFAVLRAYSPLHNIQNGAQYPAILVTTADTDDRVVPGHSFKYVAALQAAEAGEKPQLIRIETRAGHGSGKPTDKAIAEAADVMGFLAYWTGLSPSR